MKANEAPEKLYLHPTAKGNVGASWLTFPLTNEDIEYAREDTFIEKMQLFLIDKLKEIPMCGGKMKIKADCSLEEFIDEIKKYMEG